jgi:hypothetical protein
LCGAETSARHLEGKVLARVNVVENCGRDCFDVEEADEWCSIVQASHREGSRIVASLRDCLPRTALEQLQIEQIVY